MAMAGGWRKKTVMGIFYRIMLENFGRLCVLPILCIGYYTSKFSHYFLRVGLRKKSSGNFTLAHIQVYYNSYIAHFV